MRVKTVVLVVVIVSLCAGAASRLDTGVPRRSSAATAVKTATAAPAVTAEARPAPAAARPTPTIIEAPAPTLPPTPSPTAAPDPWAGHFSPAGPYLSVRDPDKGPWIYRDETLSVTVTIPKTGRFAGKYYKAEVYTRGPLPLGGFANKSGGRQTALPYRIARQSRAVLAITGDYITCTYNRKGVMIRNGKVYYDKKDAPTLAFLPSGEMKVYEPGKITARQLLALGVKNSFAFGPILVKNGKIHPSVASHKLNYHAFRAAIGQVEPGHYVVIVTKKSPTLTELAQLFIDAKCKIAYNMDGGYSAAMVFMGEQINKNLGESNLQRPLPDLLIIGSSSAVPAENAPVYGNGVKLNKKYRPKPVEGLIK